MVFRVVLPLVAALLLAVVAGSPAIAGQEILSHHAPPYSMEVDGRPSGILVDMTKAMARRLHLPDEVTFLPYARALQMTEHNPDYLMAPVGRNEEREQRFRWIGPLFQVKMSLVQVGGEKPLKLSELPRDMPLVVQNATPEQITLAELGFTNVIAVGDARIAARMLANGRIKAWFAPHLMAVSAFRDEGFGDLPLVFGPLEKAEDIYLATSRNFPEEDYQRWQAAYEEIVADGTLARIVGAYTRHGPNHQ